MSAVERQALVEEPEGRWFGTAETAAFGWLSRPVDAMGSSGVLVLPAVGYAWWSSYATLRGVAERLAAAGHLVLRLHYHGTGNAPGSQWEPGRMTAWQQSVRAGADELRALGAQSLTIVGVQMGATLALTMARELAADRVLAWRPVISGRREARTLKMRSIPVPESHGAPGAVSFAGTIFDAQLLGDIAAIDLTTLENGPARALLIDTPAADSLSERLRAAGTELELQTASDGEQALSVPTEEAVTATEVIDATADWVGVAHTTQAPTPPPADIIQFAWHGQDIRERSIRVGPHRLTGILTSPAGRRDSLATVVMLSPGSEPHVGPGNAWTELARDLASHGYQAMRVDFRGWGDSPADGFAPGRPYDAHAIDDTLDIIRATRAYGPVVLLGLCAGAWMALKATLTEPADAVIALNAPLYHELGEPWYSLMADARAARTPVRLQEEQGRDTGLWDTLDRAGERPPAGRWLDQLAASPTDVTLLFAEGDDGIEFLQNRLSRRIAELTAEGGLHVQEIAEIDHAMHRAWLRPHMFTAIRDALTRTFDLTTQRDQ